MSFSSFAVAPDSLGPNVLRVGLFAGFAPFAWREAGRGWRGRDVTFLRRFAAREKLRLEFVESRFDRLWESPGAGAVDLAASGISRREAVPGVAWSEPYAEVRRSLLVRRRDRARLHSLRDFGGARMAAVAGSAAATHAAEHLPASATLTPCATLEAGIEDLLAGRVDAVGTGSVSAEHHAARRDGLGIVDVHADAPRERIVFALPRSSPLRTRLNAFIAGHAHLY